MMYNTKDIFFSSTRGLDKRAFVGGRDRVANGLGQRKPGGTGQANATGL
jgi:hypothetical protein